MREFLRVDSFSVFGLIVDHLDFGVIPGMRKG